jgi:hypothetical protein
MADNKLLQQMLESLVNDDQAKAEELFHEYVVQQSREIYESMIDSEIAEEEEKEEDEDEVKEASDEEKEEEDKVEENFEDMAYEGDDEMDLDSEDPTDDLAGELGGEDDMEGEDKGEEDLFQDLEAIVDELQAKFDELKGHEEGEDEMGDMGDDEGGNPFAKQEGIDDLETVREYVEKVPAGHGAEKKGQAEKAEGNGGGLKFSKNDMGGASLKFGQEGGSDKGTAGGLAGNKAKEDNAGNINVPGAKNGNAFSKKEPGHGAEKAGSKESADNKQSLFRGRR